LVFPPRFKSLQLNPISTLISPKGNLYVCSLTSQKPRSLLSNGKTTFCDSSMPTCSFSNLLKLLTGVSSPASEDSEMYPDVFGSF
jgi:hypothetical protein